MHAIEDEESGEGTGHVPREDQVTAGFGGEAAAHLPHRLPEGHRGGLGSGTVGAEVGLGQRGETHDCCARHEHQAAEQEEAREQQSTPATGAMLGATRTHMHTYMVVYIHAQVK